MSVRSQLTEGVTRPLGPERTVTYRLLSERDDLAEITALLHRAYAPLAAAGLHYLASHQPADVTRKRLNRGDALVAVVDGVIVGTVTLSRVDATRGCAFYDRPDVASFGQFAVEPAFQRHGIGSALMELVEALAVERGVDYLALDTSVHAADLRRFYETRGFVEVDRVQWDAVNYPSVVLARAISSPRDDGGTR